MDLDVVFDPMLPAWPLAALIALLAMAAAAAFLARLRAAWLRALACTFLALALLNPVVVREDRERLPGIVALVVDESASQGLAERRAQTEAATAAVEQAVAGLGGYEIRKVVLADDPDADGTALFGALTQALDDVAPERVSGAVMVTDGIVHDLPQLAETAAEMLGFDAPLHALVTGEEDERDRSVALERAPRFAILGERQTLTYRVTDEGGRSGETMPVELRVNGEVVATDEARAGEPREIELPLENAGSAVVEVEVAGVPGELTLSNNVAVSEIEVVRENLRVLLVSGEPHAGERTWRNALKSDAAVDLVHFTILRPPEKQDGTPINELSLIAFPTRELFDEKIGEFDLIIFDRYQRRGVLPILYLDNVASYVRDGGAVLLAAGPDYASTGSLYRTPLGQVLPAVPTGAVIEEPYRAEVSGTGKRHPVTRDLPGSGSEPPNWSRWFRLIEADATVGEVAMTGPAENPLLVLSREGEGRVAMMLSDHAWLWARGYEGGGPHGPLLRRLVHWLMKEPDLEEEALRASARDGTLTIERQTLADEVAPVAVDLPDGSTREVALEEAAPGLWRARLDGLGQGLHRLGDGELTALAHVGQPNPREFRTVRSTTGILSPFTDASGGAVLRVSDGGAPRMPRILSASSRGPASGDDWIGLRPSQATVLRGVDRLPLFSGLLGLALLAGAFAALWYREGR